MIDEDTMGIGNHATIPIKYAVFLATSLKTNPGHPEDASWDVLSVFFLEISVLLISANHPQRDINHHELYPLVI